MKKVFLGGRGGELQSPPGLGQIRGRVRTGH